MTLSTEGRLVQIEEIARRARSLVILLIHHFCIPDRPSQLSDAQMVEVLELLEICLEQVQEHSAQDSERVV